MADLLAIISDDRSKPLPADALQDLATTYESLRGPATRRESASNGWAAACTLAHTDPAMAGVRHDGDRWAAWAGPLTRPDAAATADLAQLDGQFSLVRLTGDRIEVATDWLGMKPLYVASRGDRAYVSTSALVLAKHLDAVPLPAGIKAFLRSGSLFGPQAQWETIKRLRPAEFVRFTPQGRETGVYWMPQVDETIPRLTLAEAADRCIEWLTAELARSFRGEAAWLDLTGGFDSRLVALLARRAGVDFVANTVGDEQQEDVRLARRIAATAGWPWRRFGLAEDWVERMPALAREAVAWGDGCLDVLSLAGVMAAHREKGKSHSRLLTGGGGEQFRDHPWGHELLAAGRSNRVSYERLISWRLLLPVDLSVLRADPTAAVRSAYRAELEHHARPFSHLPNTLQCDLLYAYKSTGHFGAYQAAAGAHVNIELPLYLKPAFTVAISATPQQRRFHRLQREMIHRLDRVVAAIPTETGGPAEPLELRNLHRFGPYAWRRGRRFATRVYVSLRPFRGRAATHMPTLAERAQSALIARLRAEGKLEPGGMRSASLYRTRELEALLDRAVAHPESVDWAALGRIITVELALEATGASLD